MDKLLTIKRPSVIVLSLIALSVTAVLQYMQTYLVTDWELLHLLVIAVTLDFITGVAKSWVNRVPITSDGWRNTFRKAVQYMAFIVGTKLLVLLSIQADAFKEGAGENLVHWAYYAVIVTEIKSIYENAVEIDPRADIVGFIKERLKGLKK